MYSFYNESKIKSPHILCCSKRIQNTKRRNQQNDQENFHHKIHCRIRQQLNDFSAEFLRCDEYRAIQLAEGDLKSSYGVAFYSKPTMTKIYKIFNSKFPYERVRVRKETVDEQLYQLQIFVLVDIFTRATMI
jgi:hypothetical protein